MYYHLLQPAPLFKYICIIYPHTGLNRNFSMLFSIHGGISEGQRGPKQLKFSFFSDLGGHKMKKAFTTLSLLESSN